MVRHALTALLLTLLPATAAALTVDFEGFGKDTFSWEDTPDRIPRQHHIDIDGLTFFVEYARIAEEADGNRFLIHDPADGD